MATVLIVGVIHKARGPRDLMFRDDSSWRHQPPAVSGATGSCTPFLSVSLYLRLDFFFCFNPRMSFALITSPAISCVRPSYAKQKKRERIRIYMICIGELYILEAGAREFFCFKGDPSLTRGTWYYTDLGLDVWYVVRNGQMRQQYILAYIERIFFFYDFMK